ncbi:alpha/beta hydrolase [Actinobaculum sp. 313]|uniref:alpha/beta hydrolase n=1 Tax=Actinobaculum sp. 313 TaxID=2495645 RepID=UPI0013DE4FA6|nr:alpha/beta hydrolase [Actinobaculum sp. 313]
MASFSDLLLWKGRLLREAASELHAKALKYDYVREQLESINSDGELEGAFATAEMHSRNALADDAADIVTLYEKVANRFRDAAAEVDRICSDAYALKDEAVSYDVTINEDGTVSGIPVRWWDPGPVTLEKITPTAQEEIGSQVHQLMQRAEQLLQVLKGVYEELAGTEKLATGAPASIIQAGVSKPDPSWTPHEVNDWWTALTPAEQREIGLNHPEWIGNLDGIPLDCRSKANTIRLWSDPDYEALRAVVDELDLRDYVEDNPRDRERAIELWETLKKYAPDGHAAADKVFTVEALRAHFPMESPQALWDSPPGQYSLLVYDFNGSSEHMRGAIGVGDIDHAENVVTFTPGMTSNVLENLAGTPTSWGYDVQNMNTVLREASVQLRSNPARASEEAAGVVWLDYEPPDMNELLPLPTRGAVRSPLTTNMADDGAPRLSVFLDGLEATHAAGDFNLTNMGHSFGSLTAGLAAQETTAPDNTIFIGSPGVGTISNAELNMIGGHTFVGEADGDAVADLGWYSLDPDRVPVFENFSTDATTDADGTRYEGSEGHSEYLTKPKNPTIRSTTSVHNIASIIIGEGMAIPDKD